MLTLCWVEDNGVVNALFPAAWDENVDKSADLSSWSILHSHRHVNNLIFFMFPLSFPQNKHGVRSSGVTNKIKIPHRSRSKPRLLTPT